MYLTKLKLNKARDTAAIMARFLSGTYAEHQVLWELAGRPAEAQRDFLYRTEVTKDGLEILVLSPQPFTAVEAPWTMQSKAYAPALATGQLLAFTLRASLTIDKARAGQRSQREDLVMLKYRELEGKVPVQQVAQSAAEQWLTTRAEASGFRLVEASASGYRRLTVVQKDKPFSIPTTDIDGVLEITDPVAFLARQAKGFGKTRFAGQGLMLVKLL